MTPSRYPFPKGETDDTHRQHRRWLRIEPGTRESGATWALWPPRRAPASCVSALTTSPEQKMRMNWDAKAFRVSRLSSRGQCFAERANYRICMHKYSGVPLVTLSTLPVPHAGGSMDNLKNELTVPISLCVTTKGRFQKTFGSKMGLVERGD